MLIKRQQSRPNSGPQCLAVAVAASTLQCRLFTWRQSLGIGHFPVHFCGPKGSQWAVSIPALFGHCFGAAARRSLATLAALRAFQMAARCTPAKQLRLLTGGTSAGPIPRAVTERAGFATSPRINCGPKLATEIRPPAFNYWAAHSRRPRISPSGPLT